MTYPIHSYSSTLYFLMPGSIFFSLYFKAFLFTLTLIFRNWFIRTLTLIIVVVGAAADLRTFRTLMILYGLKCIAKPFISILKLTLFSTVACNIAPVSLVFSCLLTISIYSLNSNFLSSFLPLTVKEIIWFPLSSFLSSESVLLSSQHFKALVLSRLPQVVCIPLWRIPLLPPSPTTTLERWVASASSVAVRGRVVGGRDVKVVRILEEREKRANAREPAYREAIKPTAWWLLSSDG